MTLRSGLGTDAQEGFDCAGYQRKPFLSSMVCWLKAGCIGKQVGVKRLEALPVSLAITFHVAKVTLSQQNSLGMSCHVFKEKVFFKRNEDYEFLIYEFSLFIYQNTKLHTCGELHLEKGFKPQPEPTCLLLAFGIKAEKNITKEISSARRELAM